MQSAEWIALFRRIPQSQHDCLMLTTTIGTDIVLQRLIRLEADFLIVQGRMAGSTDQGKMLVLPYDKLTYIAFNKKMTDAEMSEVLGSPPTSANLPIAPTPNEGFAQQIEMQTPPPEPETSPEPEAASPAATGNSSRPLPPSKTVLLARLRQRLSESGKSGNPKP